MKALDGSATGREITEQLIDTGGLSDDELAVIYDTRDRSVLVYRMDWARSYCKLAGALDSPRRGLLLLSELGQELLARMSRAHANAFESSIGRSEPHDSAPHRPPTVGR